MSEEDLEHYYLLINDARDDPGGIKKIIKQIWEDAQDEALANLPKKNADDC
jgi:hypothetical protein